MWKAADLKMKIPDGTLIRIINLLVAASDSRTIGSHSEWLPMDAMVEAGDYVCIVLEALCLA